MTCEWCGEPANADLGSLEIHQNNGGWNAPDERYHAVCWEAWTAHSARAERRHLGYEA